MVDMSDSKSGGGDPVEVQVLSPVPYHGDIEQTEYHLQGGTTDSGLLVATHILP